MAVACKACEIAPCTFCVRARFTVFDVHHLAVGVIGAVKQTDSLIHKHSSRYVFFLASWSTRSLMRLCGGGEV